VSPTNPANINNPNNFNGPFNPNSPNFANPNGVNQNSPVPNGLNATQRTAGGAVVGPNGTVNNTGVPNTQLNANGRLAAENAWRMQFYNGAWWYYTPANSWMYYTNGAWAAYPIVTTGEVPTYGPAAVGTTSNGAVEAGAAPGVAAAANAPVPNAASADVDVNGQPHVSGYRGPATGTAAPAVPANGPNVVKPGADEHDRHGNSPGQNGSGTSVTGPHIDALQPAPLPAPAPNSPRN
jgi:hypothetical protein